MDNELIRLMHERHSVRQYKPVPIEKETKLAIQTFLEALQAESGLEIQLVEDAGKVFGSFLMRFIGWKRPPAAYFAFIGEKTPENAEKCGYYGEKLVLYVQSLGLNTCWVGMFKKSETADSTMITIAVGYGENSGKARKSKTAEQVSRYSGEAPAWFTDGVNCALLAPTAVNRQAFMISGEGNRVSITCHNASFSEVDLGIVKYHFEQGAGRENFEWSRCI